MNDADLLTLRQALAILADSDGAADRRRELARGVYDVLEAFHGDRFREAEPAGDYRWSWGERPHLEMLRGRVDAVARLVTEVERPG